jgi:hypothetical protein
MRPLSPMASSEYRLPPGARRAGRGALRTAAAPWSLVVGFLLAEGAARLRLVRLAGDGALRRFASIERLGDRMQGEAHASSLYVPQRHRGSIAAPCHQEGRNHHDARGYRGKSGPAIEPPGEFRICCLGGSSTYGTGDGAPEDAHPAQLEAALRRRTGRKVRVVDAGTSGRESLASTQQYFRFVQQRTDGTCPSGLFLEVPAAKMMAANPPTCLRRNLASLFAVARVQGVVPVLATCARSEKPTDEPVLTSREIVAAIAAQNAVVRVGGAGP